MLAVSLEMTIVLVKLALRVVAAPLFVKFHAGLSDEVAEKRATWLRALARSMGKSSRCSLECWSTPVANYHWVWLMSWAWVQALWILRVL